MSTHIQSILLNVEMKNGMISLTIIVASAYVRQQIVKNDDDSLESLAEAHGRVSNVDGNKNLLRFSVFQFFKKSSVFCLYPLDFFVSLSDI